MKNKLDSFPDVLRLEVVGKCNFKCIHCPTGTEPNNREQLSIEKFNYILEQLKEQKYIPRVVVLYHGGEPLLNKYLSYYIKTFKKIGVKKTVITTNASLLNEELSKELIMSGLDEIKVSFDGESPDENNKIRINGDFYKNAQNLKIFCKVRANLGYSNPKIIISNVQVCDKKKLEKLFESKEFKFKHIPDYLLRHFSDECSKIDFQSYPAMVWPGYEKLGNLNVIYYDILKPKYCPQLFETITVLSNGNVVLCCYDLKGELIIGNVFEKTIFEIWNSTKYSKIRADFRLQKYTTLCENCNVVSPRYLCAK